MQIKTILVPTDFSENARRAFETACQFAEHFKAKLVLLYAQEENSLRIAVREGLFQDDCDDEQIRARVRQLIDSKFAQLLAEQETSGMEIEHLTKRGDPKAIIDEYAREINADLIVIGMQGTSALVDALTNLVIGSVAESVIGKSHCPTLVVKMQQENE